MTLRTGDEIRQWLRDAFQMMLDRPGMFELEPEEFDSQLGSFLLALAIAERRESQRFEEEEKMRAVYNWPRPLRVARSYREDNPSASEESVRNFVISFYRELAIKTGCIE